MAPPERTTQLPRAARPAALGVAVAVTIVVVLRARVIAGATFPVIMADEGGTWSIARLVAQVGPPMPMRDLPPYPVGTGVLLAPVVRLFEGPTGRYRAALVVLALLAAVAAVLTTRFVRRLGIEDRRALAAAFVVALLFPALTTTTSFTWSETLAAVALATFLVSAQSAFARVTGTAPVLAGAVAGAMPFVHGRFTLVPMCWLVCLGIYLGRARQFDGRARSRTGLLTLLATVGVYVLGRAASAAVLSRLWSDTSSPSALVQSSLSELGFWRQLARVLLGQAWYLVAASFGCAVLGVLWLVTAARTGTTRTTAQRATVALTGLVMAAVFTTSAATLASGTYETVARGEPVRADYLVYGRYIDPVVMVLAALGVAALFARRDSGAVKRSVGAVLATYAALAGVVWLMLPDDRLPPFEPNIAGVIYLPLAGTDFDVVMWSIVSALAFIAVVGVSRLPGRWSVVLLAVLYGGASIGASSMAMEVHDRWVRELGQVDVPAPRPGRDVVVVAEDVEQARAYQYASMVQEYVLTAQGWTFDFTSLSSAELQERSPEAAGVMVLLGDRPVDEVRWRLAGQIREARVWVRRDG
jgi:hypothetical protein